MGTWVEKQLKVMADRIREETKGAMLYGHPVDWDNPDMAIVAAYWLGQEKMSVMDLKQYEILESIRI